MATKVVTGKVRFSYVNVFKAKSINGGDEKYSVSLIITKDDKETLKKIKAAIAGLRGEFEKTTETPEEAQQMLHHNLYYLYEK